MYILFQECTEHAEYLLQLFTEYIEKIYQDELGRVTMKGCSLPKHTLALVWGAKSPLQLGLIQPTRLITPVFP